jgi:hypothetical protein
VRTRKTSYFRIFARFTTTSQITLGISDNLIAGSRCLGGEHRGHVWHTILQLRSLKRGWPEMDCTRGNWRPAGFAIQVKGTALIPLSLWSVSVMLQPLHKSDVCRFSVSRPAARLQRRTTHHSRVHVRYLVVNLNLPTWSREV